MTKIGLNTLKIVSKYGVAGLPDSATLPQRMALELLARRKVKMNNAEKETIQEAIDAMQAAYDALYSSWHRFAEENEPEPLVMQNLTESITMLRFRFQDRPSK